MSGGGGSRGGEVICHSDTLGDQVHMCGLCVGWCLSFILIWSSCGRLCWYLWSVLPLETMSVIRASTGDYIKICGLWCHWKTCWCLWFILWPRSVPLEALMIPSPCFYWKLRCGPSLVVQLEAKWMSMIHTATVLIYVVFTAVGNHVEVHDPWCSWLLLAWKHLL